jgi:two-component sensor histidine kinase/streptogramin lyase
VAALAAGDAAYALDPRKSIAEYHRQQWQTEQGLPQNTIFDTVQTKDGYLWFATIGGLARFDGVRFTSFLPSEAAGLPSGVIWALCAGADGGLWIGTERGLARYKDGRFESFVSKEGLGGDPVISLHEDAQGALWIGFSVPGLARLKDGVVRRFGVEEGLPKAPVKSIAHDVAGDIWIGGVAGLSRLHDGRFTTLTAKDGLAEDHVSALYIDRAGAIWTGGGRGGKTRLLHGSVTVYPAADAHGPGIYTIREDGDGQMWFATAGAGLERIHDGHLSRYVREELSSLRALCIDDEGNLWVGTAAYGVVRLKDTPLITYSMAEGLIDKSVRSVSALADGRVVVANRYSLRALESGGFRELPLPQPAPNGIYPLLTDRRGRLWMGTSEYLARLDQGRWSRFLTGVDPNLYVHALHEDRQGDVWAGTEHGLFRFHGDTITKYTTADGLAGDQVFAVADDPAGAIWLGTRGNGISVLRDGRFTTYTPADGLAGASIRDIHADSDGTVWIGTSEGLTRFRNGTFIAYGPPQGLADQAVHAILDDSYGYLWMCGVEGLSRVRKRDLDEVAAGGASTVVPRLYGTSDGMRNKTCSGGAAPGGARTQDGRLWFATADGVVVVNPGDLGRRNELPPPVVVEEVRVDRRAQALGGDVELPPGSHQIEIEYTALSFAAPERVRFQYRLEGYDADWVDPGTRRTAYYMNLPPGAYTFRVKAANNDGVWNQDGAAFAFRLRPHLYQRRDARLLAVLALVIAVLALNRRHTHVLRRRQQELLRAVDERTRELKLIQAELEERVRQRTADLRGLVGEKELLLKEIHHRVKNNLQIISSLLSLQASQAKDARVRGMFGETQGRVRAIATVHEKLYQSGSVARIEVAEYLRSVASQLFSSYGGADRILLRIEAEPLELGLDTAIPCGLIVNELVSNALKHAFPDGRRGEIVIEMGLAEPGGFRLRVADDGVGLPDPAPPRDGSLGLELVRALTDQLDGLLEVNRHGGTAFTITFSEPRYRDRVPD